MSEKKEWWFGASSAARNGSSSPSALDQVFRDKEGRDMLFTAGVEVGRVKGREEFAQYLIVKFRKVSQGKPISFPDFVQAELVNFKRDYS